MLALRNCVEVMLRFSKYFLSAFYEIIFTRHLNALESSKFTKMFEYFHSFDDNFCFGKTSSLPIILFVYGLLQSQRPK